MVASNDLRKHPDIFTSDEAAEYLRLPNPETLATLRQNYGLQPLAGVTKCHLYHREDLDLCVKRMFGKDESWQRRGEKLRLAK